MRLQWLSWPSKIRSWYCLTLHAFVYLLNTARSQMKPNLLVVNLFSLKAIVHFGGSVSYHVVWCILLGKMMIKSKVKLLTLIISMTATYSQFTGCVINAFMALCNPVTTFALPITLIWTMFCQNYRRLCLWYHILFAWSSRTKTCHLWP